MDRELTSKYIRENFDPWDRLAVQLVDRRTGAVSQRIAFADHIALKRNFA